MTIEERVELYKSLYKECKALEPVANTLAKGYKQADPRKRLELIRELDTELALRLKPKLTQEAKERQGERVDLKSNIVEKLPQCKRVAEQLGEIAGVSSKTIYNTETILTKGTKEDIQALVLPLWAPLCLL